VFVWTINVAVAQEPSPIASPAASGSGHPAYLHVDTCTKLGKVVFPLAQVSGGRSGLAEAIPVSVSVTTITASIEDLTSAEHAINIVESDAEIDRTIACGDIGVGTPKRDMFIGVKEVDSSRNSGIAWLHENDDKTTTVTIFLAEGLGDNGSSGPTPTANG
jgi:hypothetical protein